MEMREALQLARLAGGPAALTAREALELAATPGARCLEREAEIGSLEPGKLANVPLWRVDDLAYAGIDDPVAALDFGPAPRVELLLVNGQALVEGGELKTADIERVAGELDTASKSLVRKSQEPIADSS